MKKLLKTLFIFNGARFFRIHRSKGGLVDLALTNVAKGTEGRRESFATVSDEQNC